MDKLTCRPRCLNHKVGIPEVVRLWEVVDGVMMGGGIPTLGMEANHQRRRGNQVLDMLDPNPRTFSLKLVIGRARFDLKLWHYMAYQLDFFMG